MNENPTAATAFRAERELPEHILLWCEALQLNPLRRLLPPDRRPGEWGLITLSAYEAEYYCPAIASWETSAHEPLGSLANWVTSHLGYPVRLEADPAGVEKPGWIRVLYGVRRDEVRDEEED